MKNSFLIALIAALALVSCATPGLRPGSHLQIVEGGVLPPPGDAILSGEERPYRVGPFDRLGIQVYGVPDLSQSIQVDAGGRISLPLAGTINASGKTPDEIAQEIAANLRGRYVRDPQVSINLEETVSQVVTVDGQVQEPGLYPVVGRMTLMRAIATAKGVGEFARLQDVVVFRTVNDQQMAALYNLGAIRRGLYPDPEVFANDVVIVGDSPARRMFRDLLQASPLFLTPIVAILQR